MSHSAELFDCYVYVYMYITTKERGTASVRPEETSAAVSVVVTTMSIPATTGVLISS